MSVIVDTGVLYAHHDVDAHRHEIARAAMKRIVAGEYGQPFISDHIYDETVTLTRTRTGRYADTKQVSNHLIGQPSPFELLVVDKSQFQRAIETFDRYDDHALSFTDATTISLLEQRDIDHVLAFDDDFDGIVSRLSPGEIA
ncbi:type II toxin-antitoxin system VapC family toxin [Halorhabdus rudnickae]|uniref:type II toxin-antitoxin system VapC family toxin n=1 Tax=Halorhabdus rudnickae TaxID=1775544 RepID=UPI0010838C1F|nr:PIN domain-containing protein [Halorhabdus rudnickae]